MDWKSSKAGANSAVKRAVSRLCSNSITDLLTAEKSSLVTTSDGAAVAGDARTNSNRAASKCATRFGMEREGVKFFIVETNGWSDRKGRQGELQQGKSEMTQSHYRPGISLIFS